MEQQIRLVVKVGTSTLTRANGSINLRSVDHLARVLSDLHGQGHQVILVSSGAIAMGVAVAKSVEGIARQPEAESKIRTTLMLGLVFIETAIIYALLVVILIIFVL